MPTHTMEGFVGPLKGASKEEEHFCSDATVQATHRPSGSYAKMFEDMVSSMLCAQVKLAGVLGPRGRGFRRGTWQLA